MAKPVVFVEAQTKDERAKKLLAQHTEKLSQISANPTQSTILSEGELTLEEIKQALGLQSTKEIPLPAIGDGFGGNLIRVVVQTDNPNVYIENSVREKQPTFGNSKIMYFGNESNGLKRFQANFAESEK